MQEPVGRKPVTIPENVHKISERIRRKSERSQRQIAKFIGIIIIRLLKIIYCKKKQINNKNL